MPVIWKPQLSTGNDLIDRDHKYLISLFNSIELSLVKPDSLQFLPIFFRELLEYTREHFAREERIQIKIRYPYYAEHKMEHQKIIEHLEKLNDMVLKLMAAREKLGDERIHDRLDSEIISLAREWIIDHVVKTDGKMARFLKQHPQELADC